MSIVRPELKRLHSPDVFDLNKPMIDDSAPFCVLLQAMFGPEGAEGEESFDMLVCNPKWIEARAKERAFSGRHHLIVLGFDINQIRSFLVEYSGKCSGSTWSEVAEKLGRIGRWEFEDYIDHPNSA
jgi:hypothetical protein